MYAIPSPSVEAMEDASLDDVTMSPVAPAGPRTARLINDRRAYDLLLERGPLTRTDLRMLTGLSRPSIGDLVGRLEAQGLIAVVGEAGVERRGPNARLYGVVADRRYAAGVEVREQTVSAALVDMTGHQVAEASVPQSPDSTPDRLVGTAVESALASAGVPSEKLGSIVVGTPGLVDPVSGDVSYVAALPSWHANLLPGLRQTFDFPVVVENEINLVGLAEHRLGAARGRSTFALFWIGEGTGMAVVLGGRLYHGISGGAGEAAYIPVGPDETVQSSTGGKAIRELATHLGIGGGDTTDGAELDLEGLVEATREAGQLPALADRVALGATAVCAVLDPGVIVLAGPIARAGGDELARHVEERLRARVPLATKVFPGEVGGNPVVRGAVLVALDAVHAEAFGG